MTLSIGKRDVRKMAALLEEDFETVEEAAQAAIELAWEIYESKAKWTVVGQLYYSPQGGWLNSSDAKAAMVALDRFGTEKQANTAAEGLRVSKATGEQFRAWVLPVFHGTPASYFAAKAKAQKKEMEDADIPGPLSMEAALERLRQENGWVSLEDAQPAEEVCSECGFPIAEEISPLVSGHEATG